MIKILIVEDEIPARKKLRRFLDEVKEPISVEAEIDTVQDAVNFLKTAVSIDLILSDIELLDGNAFAIYREVQVTCPIIFTTAYDRFWMDAFESNGIEYLLKPFSLERFQKAWDKFLLLRKNQSTDHSLLSKLDQILGNTAEKKYKTRFSVHTNQGIYFFETKDILFFEADEGVVFALDKTGKRHILNVSTLKEIEIQLDPMEFFRINRSELVNKKLIEKIERYSKNALALKMEGFDRYLITSQSNTSLFREWIEK
ncbi:LytR/AlgR family response regulator transcription factor [Chryseobacterium vrystaatense]|uniref:Two component transcriptional regulator, LytTR family n=1 Tax=Chryseobacterium vrystaatense TaxID=307480 RepID=A0A1M5K9K8_9FLAO|nr:LytTR family DNA-binding domain-containing protein [Chryseobacterium vrystaatense]SHG49516.1 two component transcriptional regulator, LytTR family [Chryseobacterium vrystaatense]